MRAHAAITMLRDHSIFATMTPDGVLAVGESYDFTHNDAFDDPMVFEVDDAGHVDSDEVRTWLGY